MDEEIPSWPNPGKQWLAFLKNHRNTIAAMGFFTVPTLTFGVLHCPFVIGHDRRSILHCHVARNPCGFWTACSCGDLAIRCLSQIPGLRPGRQVLVRSRVHPSEARHDTGPYFVPQPGKMVWLERWVGNIRRELLSPDLWSERSTPGALKSSHMRPATARAAAIPRSLSGAISRWAT